MTERKIPYVYIVGLSHSGSTLLAFLLNTHPRLISVGEASRLGELLPKRWVRRNDLCSCGKPFYYCEFWNRSLAGLAARGFGLREKDPFDTGEQEQEVSRRKWVAFVEAALDVSGADVFVDASKPARYIPQLEQNAGLEVKYLNLLRDGRGVVHSWKKRLPEKSFEEILQSWIIQEEDRRNWLASVSEEKVLDVRYEPLCLSPRETLEEIYRFLGVEIPEMVSGFKSDAEHHIIGNQMRLTGEDEIRLDEAWRRMLSAEELASFDQMGGSSINALNGYHG